MLMGLTFDFAKRSVKPANEKASESGIAMFIKIVQLTIGEQGTAD
jgi:hypothetical protein